jgi:hypothetical protein
MFLIRRLAGLDRRPSPARESAFRDAIDNAVELKRRVDARFPTPAKPRSQVVCIARRRIASYRLFNGPTGKQCPNARRSLKDRKRDCLTNLLHLELSCSGLKRGSQKE